MGVRRTALAGLLVLAAALAGCTQPEDPAEPEARPVLSAADAPVAVQGRDFVPTGDVALARDGKTIAFAGWTASWLGIHVRAVGAWTPRGAEKVAVEARDDASGARTVISDLSGRTTQAGPVTVQDDVVAWIAYRPRGTGELHVRDLAADIAHIVTAPLEVGGDDVWLPVEQAPVVDRGHVYVVGRRAQDPSAPTSVYDVPPSGEPVEIAPGATAVFGDTDGMLQVAFADRIVRWDPSKGVGGEVEGTSLPVATEAFASEGVRLRVEPGRLLVDAPVGRWAVDTGGLGVGNLAATADWAAFTLEGRGLLLDLRTGTLVRTSLGTAYPAHRPAGAFLLRPTAVGSWPREHPAFALGDPRD